MTKNTKAVILGGVAVLSWSTVATAFKIALSHLTVFNMLLVATVTSALIFSVVMTAGKRWGELARLPKKLIAMCAALGVLNPVLYYLVLFKAYDMLPAQMAQPLNYAWPIVLLILLAVFNHESIPTRKYIGMFVSVSGVACISLGVGDIEGGVSPAGILMAVSSAALWACYWMFSNRLKDEVHPTVALFLGFTAGTVVLLIAGCFVGIRVDSMSGLLSGIYIGFFEMGIPFLAFGTALRITDNPALINQMCYLSPFLSLFLISLVLGETILPTTCIGLILIVAGLIYNQYFVSSPSPSPASPNP